MATALATWEAGRPTREAVAIQTSEANVYTAHATFVAAHATFDAAEATMSAPQATLEAAMTALKAPAPEKVEAAWVTYDAVYATWIPQGDNVEKAVKTAQAARETLEAAHFHLFARAPEKAAAAGATWTAVAALATPTARPTPTSPTPHYRVSVDGAVNLRSGPGTNHASVGVARPGDTFEVIGYQAGSPYNWLKVRYDGGVAWIAESLTRLQRVMRRRRRIET